MENEISKRLAEIIECKTGGNRIMFATKLGWSKQRLGNVLAGKSVGLSVIEDTLRAYKDINARWLLFGEGNMLTIPHLHLGKRYDLIKSFERYLPVMTDAEVSLLTSGKNDWTEEDIKRWDDLTEKRQQILSDRFNAAYQRQQETA